MNTLSLSDVKFEMKTKKGYDFFEVSSAFQKSVRRGLEEEALYWGIELFNSNYDEYLWKRIKIITSEDVGLASINMPIIIEALYNNYTEQKKKKDEKNRPERLFLIHAILLLVRAPKSRLVDWTLISFFNNHETDDREIPEYALDNHTIRGKKMGRNYKYFYDESSKLNNHTLLDKEEERKKLAKDSEENKKKAQLF